VTNELTDAIEAARAAVKAAVILAGDVGRAEVTAAIVEALADGLQAGQS